MMIPTKLRKAIENNNLVVFAGSGTSIKLGLPDWKNLVIGVIDELSNDKPAFKAYKQLLEVDVETPLSVLDKLEKNYKKDIYRYLTEKLNINLDISRLSLQNKIWALSSKVITTNYDKAFESAKPDLKTTIPHNSLYLLSSISTTREFLFKIHGDIQTPDSCILFTNQYEDLYHHNEAFTLELRKLLTDKTILFIGFSFNDPFLEQMVEFIQKIYGGYNGDHFIITTDKIFETKPISTTVKTILLDNYSLLEGYLDDLILIKTNNLSTRTDEPVLTNRYNKSYFPKFKILHASPIDKEINNIVENLVDELEKYNVDISTDFLNIDGLQSIVDENYLFLFSKLIKNKIIVEDEYLKSYQIDINELDENIPCSLNAIIIFYDGEDIDFSNLRQLKNSYIFINVKDKKPRDSVNKLLYHFFIKAEIPNVDYFSVFQSDGIVYDKLSRGKATHNTYHPNISKYIDSKLLVKFVGRKTDIENIIRKLIDLKHENKILTIKGSGGIGKTTIVTKAALEIAKRKYYNAGIYFIPCQAIYSYENFEFELSLCFDLSSSIKFKEQVIENYNGKNRLIILDNFETLLHVSDKDQIIELVSFICDYACVVTTTRQLLGLDFEEIYELRNFTTDEGVSLFKSLYPNIKDSDEKILRVDIVERLLNNNPLAIKLIAKGLPPHKNLSVLKDELEDNIFKDENIEQIFERQEDLNIEKSKSLYYSIYYSYQKLTAKEQFTFELLSLFPDGIHLENLKAFSKKSEKSSHKVDDKDIRSLDDKSLLEKINNFLKLQSIISRFSDAQFLKRDSTVRDGYYTQMFGYNSFLLGTFGKKVFRRAGSVRLLDSNYNNFLKVLSVLENLNVDFEDKLQFVYNVEEVYRNTNQTEHFLKRIEMLKPYFKKFENGDLFINVLEVLVIYWTRDFENSFALLCTILPFDKIKELDLRKKITRYVYHLSSSIYACEGYEYELAKHFIDTEYYNHRTDFSIFKLGYHAEAYQVISAVNFESDFVELEIKSTVGTLGVNDMDQYISKIFKKESLEIIQCSYIRSKKQSYTSANIKTFVVSNPYTRGLINLMRVAATESPSEKKIQFIKAIEDLEHIKYYYIESIYAFAKFLNEIKDEEFAKWHEKGYSMAKEYHYAYLVYKFEQIFRPDLAYDQNYYTSLYSPLPNLSRHVKKYIEKNID